MADKKRQAFNFYRSYYDILDDITRDEDKLTYLLALLDRQFKGIEPTLEKIPRLVYNSQKHSIDKQVAGWESKSGVKLTPTEDPYLPPTEGPTEGSTEGTSDAIVKTTEGSSEGPYLQEQEKGKEEVKEQEEIIIGNEKVKTLDINYSGETQSMFDSLNNMSEDELKKHYV